MPDTRDIRIKYSKLSRAEKEMVGSALVKVNLGVAMPADLRRAALFLKGTGFIAKTGELEQVIDLLHSAAQSSSQPEEISLIHQTVSKNTARGVAHHKEDGDKTLTDHKARGVQKK